MRLCLNMIVKNEGHIITDTLTNLTSYIKFDYYVISDTGSSDDTKEKIVTFFKAKNIPGEIHDDAWKDFGHNRSKALEHAYNKTDYVFVWDADDSISGDFALPEDLHHDKYLFIFGTTQTYERAQLFNNRKRWRYIGVLHEYPSSIEDSGQSHRIVGSYHFNSGRTGARSQDPNKYMNDAKILAAAYEDALSKKDDIHMRYAFYCANSYRDTGKKELALEWYKKVLTLNNWVQEKYVSCKEISVIYESLGKFDEGLPYLIESFKYDTTRVECATKLIKYYCIKQNYEVAYAYYTIIQSFVETKMLEDNLSSRLFVDTKDYEFYLPYYMIIVASYAKRESTGIKMYELLAKKKALNGEWWMHNLFSNLQFYISHVNRENLVFLQLMLSYFDVVRESGIVFKPIHYEVMTKLIAVYHPLLTRPLQFTITDKSSPRVIMTITTCKRLYLFKQTMNSILHTWKDLSLVTTILCVDDNSSEEDRRAMRSLYPFIEFYMKTPAEKGHRQSMNIIWDYLHKKKPIYWVHMEDDWFFYREDSYISKSIAVLDKYQDKGTHQILYNRNYAETFRDFQSNGGIPLEPGFILHEKSDTVPGRNSAYWPHYSFRPSMVRVAPILELGNYDSPNTFFERDYANRYFAANYTSAFFDTITSFHIGKLTSDKTGVNAYTLNGEDQGLSLTSKQGPKQFIVNLLRRPDRKAAVTGAFADAGIGPYSFVEATDGMTLAASSSLSKLFIGNDFGSRRGVIGCALSHYTLWQNLLADGSANMYIIYEDDISFVKDATAKIEQAIIDAAGGDVFFLGFTARDDNIRYVTSDTGKTELNKDTYIGGTFGYILTKTGAQKLCNYITQKGIKHGIDYLFKIVPDLVCWAAQPHIVLSEQVQSADSAVDSDIQKSYDSIDLLEPQWLFFRELDSGGNDIKFVGRKVNAQLAAESNTVDAVAFNTLGFLKSRIQFPLVQSRYIQGAAEGLYIRKLRVKMLCNWCSPKELCDEWNKMSKGNYTWNGITIVWEGPADYYVIINKPQNNEFYEPAKTIIFHMEPWCGSANQSWGVKTWGLWAKPDPQKFLMVRSHDRAVNTGFWQVSWTYNDFKTKIIEKTSDGISSICSSKYFDPGHIKRIDFLKFLEQRGVPVHIYNSDNHHNFSSYKGRADPFIDKEKGLIPYKYYFMCENNEEHNFITEKLWEPILCESLCFYWGCPNVSDIVNPEAFVQLDMNNFAASLQIVQTALRENWWEKRLPAIRKEKEKILEGWGFFPTLERILYSKEQLGC